MGPVSLRPIQPPKKNQPFARLPKCRGEGSSKTERAQMQQEEKTGGRKKLADKVALVTGGTSGTCSLIASMDECVYLDRMIDPVINSVFCKKGIGEASVGLFVQEGAQVAFTGRREDLGIAIQHRLQSSYPSSSNRAFFIKADHSLLGTTCLLLLSFECQLLKLLPSPRGLQEGGGRYDSSLWTNRHSLQQCWRCVVGQNRRGDLGRGMGASNES